MVLPCTNEKITIFKLIIANDVTNHGITEEIYKKIQL